MSGSHSSDQNSRHQPVTGGGAYQPDGNKGQSWTGCAWPGRHRTPQPSADTGSDLIRKNSQQIEAANQTDVERGRRAGLTDAFIDRLAMTEDRIEAMAAGLEDIARLADPLGVELARWTVRTVWISPAYQPRWA